MKKRRLVLIGIVLFSAFIYTQNLEKTFSWENIYFDDFEADLFSLPTWDRSESTGGYSWGRTHKKQFTGQYSLWCVGDARDDNPKLDPTIHNYPPSVEAWAKCTVPIDLFNCTDAEIVYDTWRRLNGTDYFEVLARADTNSFIGHRFYSTSDGWDEVHLSFKNWPQLGNLIGKRVYIALHFSSNSNAAVDRGVFLDNFMIRQYKSEMSPDLTGSSFDCSPPVASPNDSITLNLTAINNGSLSSSETDVHFYLSADETVTETDYLLGQASIGDLDPLETEWIHRLFFLPSSLPDGDYRPGFFIDQEDNVDESNEANNSGVSDCTILYNSSGSVVYAAFTAMPVSGSAPLNVCFYDQSSGEILNHTWDFGDGGTSTMQNPVYTFLSPGTYSVSLAVTGSSDSDTEIKNNYIMVDAVLTNVTFETHFGDPAHEMGNSVRQTTDGGYIVGVNTNFFDPGEFDLLKADPSGNEEWRSDFDGYYNSAIQSWDGGYVMTGRRSSILSDDHIWEMTLTKANSDGSLAWSQIFYRPYFGPGITQGASQGYSVQQTHDGGYIIAGMNGCYDDEDEWSRTYVMKTDGNGTTLWEDEYSYSPAAYGGFWDEGFSIQQTSDGGYIITGFAFLKINQTGIVFWWNHDGSGKCVEQTLDGGYVIASDSPDLIRTDMNGNVLWTRDFDGTFNCVQQTFDLGFVLTGFIENEGSGKDLLLLRCDTAGDELWSATFGGSNDDIGYSVRQTSDAGYVMTGGTRSFGAGDWDVYLIKTDPDGNTEGGSIVHSPDASSPEHFALARNYPNPFNSGTVIEYRLPKTCHVLISVYDILGCHIKTLADERQSPGEYSSHWNGTDENGKNVPSGLYFYRFISDDFVRTYKMILLE